MIKLISPNEIESHKSAIIPPQVIEIFNYLIAKNFNNGVSTVTQDEAMALITQTLECTRSTVFQNHWLDIEDLYRAQGWSVEYDKPGYNENYKARFKFKKR